MAPSQNESGRIAEEHIEPGAQVSDDSIVITGMSALMPGCRALDEFADKLYKMENIVTNEKPRWNFTHPEVAAFHGKVPELELFDAQFFMIHYRLSQSTNAMSRKLLEHSYQAIIDAGVCPTELSGKRVGVFVATGVTEMDRVYSSSFYGSGLLGSSRSMIANRISYWLNTKGPSYILDASCTSSLSALQCACEAMETGLCDAAIIGGARLTLHPQSSINYRRLVPLNLDGKTKCYDVNADGQTMTEAAVTLFVQKYKDAKRVYAEIYHIKSNYAEGLGEGFQDRYGPYRDPLKLSKFLHQFYEEAGVSPSSVEYVEGFGAAVPDVDKAELQAIEQVFCKQRSEPLLVGSVTSNIGFADAVSGLCGIVKLLLGYHRGELAANLFCENPRQDIGALQDGRMRIVTSNEKFQRSFAALNNFSVTGMNAHLLLKGHYKRKDLSRYRCEIPYLVMVSGRQESGVQKILDNIKMNELDPEEIALFHSIHKTRILKHMARGFAIYASQNQKTETHCEKVDYFDDKKRPLWFVYSGMGSQWAGMGAQLMRIPIFAAAIHRCDKVLKPKGLDIVDIITTPDETVFDNILHSFVGIAAIQIGLTDVLHAVGLFPDNIIGHSQGELGCAYADGCCTAEEVILMAYSRGLISTQTPFIRGSMAAVGIGYKEILKLCPPEIEVACHNSRDSSTISGPADVMDKFVGQLSSRGIFAKEVKTSNIAYHSRYIAEAGPHLLRYLKEIITEPKLRSERWLSTSVPQNKWHEHDAKYSSAEYHTNNLLSPVLFEETSQLVPVGAVLVEVAPHGLLQAILKRSLPADCRNVPLTKRHHDNNVIFLLEALGKLYMEGYDLDISALYPKVEFPVSTQTRQLSHLVEWIHTEEWNVDLCRTAHREYTAIYKPNVTVYDEDYTFLKGSIIEGTRTFPLAGALVFVWDTLSMTIGRPLRETTVQFRNLKFLKQPVLTDNKTFRLVITLQRGSGRFEVTHEGMLVVEGQILAAKENYRVLSTTNTDDPMVLNSSDIYRLLFGRGYEYKNDFRVIHRSNLQLTRAQLLWKDNWITFIDGLLQLCTLRHEHNGVSQPQYIKRICIDMKTHKYSIADPLIEAIFSKEQSLARCGGLSIEDIMFKDKPLLKQPVVLHGLNFIPFYQEENKDMMTAMYVFIQMIAESLNKDNLLILNIDNEKKPSVVDKITSMTNGSSVKQIQVIDVKADVRVTNYSNNPDAIILNHTTCNMNMLETLYSIYPDAFLITIGANIKDSLNSSLYKQISVVGKGQSKLELARWRSNTLSAVAMTVTRQEDIQSLIVARNNLQPHQKLVIFTSYPPPKDVKNLVKQWRAEENQNQVCLAMVNDRYRVDMKQLPNFELAFSIFDQDKWGGEYYVPISTNCVKHNIVALRCRKPGDLSSLYWAEKSSTYQPRDIKVQVHYAELNAYDAKMALGQISMKYKPEQGFGISFSGITNRGEYVMGLAPNGSASEQISAHPDYLWPVPKHWSLEDAATVPLAYSIAFYCLGIKGQLVPGSSVLVHGGAGAVGQAAISIALASGCKVFTTVSDHSKKEFIKRLFPDLPAHHIGNSRDETFKDMILSLTKGEGCRIIISSVTGQIKQATLFCCGFMGIIFDLVQIHTREDFMYGMSHMMGSKSYKTIDISSIFSKSGSQEFAKIRAMLSDGISRGYVRPLSRVKYAPKDVVRALRLLATSQHCGKVLLSMRDELPMYTQPRLSCSPDLCHMLLCDEDGFGIILADRLVEQGAKKLCLHVPKSSHYVLYKKQSWEKLDVDVRIVFDALDSIEAIRKLFIEGMQLGSIEGLYVIATESIDKEKRDRINSTIFKLDLVSKELCSSIRYFVVINNDGFTGRDVCLNRKQCHLKSVSIQLHLKQFTDTKEKIDKKDVAMLWSCAAEAVELALTSNEAAVLVYLPPVQPCNILEEVIKIPGFIIKSSIDDKTELKQVGIDDGRAEELCKLLEEKFNYNIPKDIVPSMTVGQLKKLKVQTVELDKEVPGFNGYFSYIDDDEMLGSCDLVFMPTLTHALNTKPEEYADNEKYLCIVPGMEGHHERFRVFCELLKLPAVVLQLGLEKYDETIQEIAQRLVNVLMTKLKINDEFYLLGYEFGVPIVIEMAIILESYGLSGTVYCLGGMPNDIRANLDNKLQDMTDETLENTLLQHMHSLILGDTATDTIEKLRNFSEFSNKVKYCVDNLRGRVSHSSQYIETLLEVAYSRLKLTRNFNNELSLLKAKMVILRAKLPAITPIETWKFSHQEVLIYQLKATLEHAPEDLSCAALVNRHLDPNILDQFYKRNRCESYFKSGEIE